MNRSVLNGPKWTQMDQMEHGGLNGQSRTEWEQGGLNRTKVDWIGQSGPMWTE